MAAVQFAILCYFYSLFSTVTSLSDHRISVINVILENQYLAFQTLSGKLQFAVSTDSQHWGPWVNVNTSAVTYPTLTSNPISLIDGYTKGVTVFVQATDGQVYMFSKENTQQTNVTFLVKSLSSKIPSDLPAAKFSLDGVKSIHTHQTNMTHLFVRSQSKQSRIYYSYQDWNKGTWSEFVPIGDDKHFLAFDFDVVLNTFVWRVEVYVVTEDMNMRHTWQTSPTSFKDSWHYLVLFPPKFNAAPAAHTMGHSDFNGVIEVFGREGNTLHHIHQTTCDKVSNPWGPCTWEAGFHQLGDDLLSDPKSVNPLTVTNNIHLGLEVFIVGEKDNHLYHIWQPERGKSWSSWEDLGGFTSGGNFGSQVCIVINSDGWWDAYGISSDTNLVDKLVQTPFQFTAAPSSVQYNQNVTVSWNIPRDEATHKDWIGVYPSGSNNLKYVDFMYVGGTQNPLADPVPKGQVKLTAVLPNGKYDYRYLVNKEFFSILQNTVEVSGAVQEAEWVELYQGISRGLNNLNTNLTACVHDGNVTVDQFRASFKAFEDRQIIEGLQLFGKALKDVEKTLIQCEENEIAKKLEKFIEDLISCTESNCANFAIDIGLEILVLYERIYEIYGDIYAAKNAFDIHAYEMGGICIGRVTYACLTLPGIKYYN